VGVRFLRGKRNKEKGGKLGKKRKEKEAKAMTSERMDQQWRALSEEILFGLKEWREQHPKATLLEIEEEVNKQMSRLGAQVIQDAAQSSPAADWTSHPAVSSVEACWCPEGNGDDSCRAVEEHRWNW
jgi:hypothetical protein